MGTFHRTYSPFHHLRATMAFAVSTQALAAKVALNGKTLNVRKSSVKAARNVTVRAAVSAPAGLKAGVVTGDDYRAVIDHAKKNSYAIPAVNCTMSTVTNACLEAAKVANSPMIIQFSNGGGIYNAGKGWKNEADQKAAIMGCVAGALHVRALAEFYGVPIILPRGHPRGHHLRRHEDEHRHRHPVVHVGRRPRLRRGEARLPPGPDRQPRRPGEAQQEVLRPPHVVPRRRGVHPRPPPLRVRGPQRHGRPLQVNLFI